MSASPPGGAPAELHAPPPAEALAAWATACDGPRLLPVVRVIVEDALGRVTAEPVWARRSSPAFPAAAMDGIAVAGPDTRAASEADPMRLARARFDVVDTGDPLPAGRDAVIPRERLTFRDDGVLIDAPVAPGTHVRGIGEDARRRTRRSSAPARRSRSARHGATRPRRRPSSPRRSARCWPGSSTPTSAPTRMRRSPSRARTSA